MQYPVQCVHVYVYVCVWESVPWSVGVALFSLAAIAAEQLVVSEGQVQRMCGPLSLPPTGILVPLCLSSTHIAN